MPFSNLDIENSCLELVLITVHVIFILDIIFFKNQCLLMWSQTGCTQIRTDKMSRSGSKMFDTVKVSKGAKIRNRYNQVPHLTQDTNVLFVVKSDIGKIYRKITQ